MLTHEILYLRKSLNMSSNSNIRRIDIVRWILFIIWWLFTTISSIARFLLLLFLNLYYNLSRFNLFFSLFTVSEQFRFSLFKQFFLYKSWKRIRNQIFGHWSLSRRHKNLLLTSFWLTLCVISQLINTRRWKLVQRTSCFWPSFNWRRMRENWSRLYRRWRRSNSAQILNLIPGADIIFAHIRLISSNPTKINNISFNLLP